MLVQGGGQTGLADDVGRAAGALVVEELRGGQRRGPDVLDGDVQAHAGEPGLQVAGGVDGVVGQHQEGLAGLAAAA